MYAHRPIINDTMQTLFFAILSQELVDYVQCNGTNGFEIVLPSKVDQLYIYIYRTFSFLYRMKI